MARTQSDVTELLDAIRAGGDLDVIRSGVELVLQALIDTEATEVIGAGPHERTETRTNQRNGTRARLLSTKAGDVELRIPKLRRGSFFPAVLERRRRIDGALYAVVMEAYVHGVSTRKVDDLVAALGLESGISKSEVSRICGELDASLEAFRTRPLGHAEFPYVFLDATYVKAREAGRVVNKAVVVATGVSRTGDREVLGCAAGDSEDGAFWMAFLRSLRARGLSGVKLVISDAHEGLVGAIEAVLIGASWQRCRVHFMRNVIAQVAKGAQAMVAATVRTIFEQPDRAAARAQLRQVCATLQERFPKVVALLEEAEGEVLTFYDFPREHWRQVYSTNPLERLNKELRRRSAVVGIFPNRASVIRLFGALLAEQTEEWLVGHRYFSLASMAALLQPPAAELPEPDAAVA